MMTTPNRDDADNLGPSLNTDANTQPREKPTWDSQQIMQGQREVLIKHGTETYRLMLTKANKLILQK